MRRKLQTSGERRAHVALLIETSLAAGRDILKGIARYVREHESWALYHEPHGLAESIPTWIRRWRGDGVIARVQTREIDRELRASGVPVVDVLGSVPTARFPLVHVDNAAIGRLAGEHLLERGLKHFAFFGIRRENWSKERYESFRSRVGSNVAIHEFPRGTIDRKSWERVENELARWVGGLPKPIGIFVCSDQRGAQVLEACRRAGISVPAQAAVVGVDNDESLCEVCDPPLSSIDADHVSVGYQAAEVLARRMKESRDLPSSPEPPRWIKPRRVVPRLSTETLAIDDAAVASALHLIRERAHEGINIEQIAQRTGVSRSVLQRKFRKLLNRSIHDEILNARIRRAQELLTKTDLPLAIVAERAGFNFAEYMGAVFKQHLGVTPGTLRRGAHK